MALLMIGPIHGVQQVLCCSVGRVIGRHSGRQIRDAACILLFGTIWVVGVTGDRGGLCVPGLCLLALLMLRPLVLDVTVLGMMEAVSFSHRSCHSGGLQPNRASTESRWAEVSEMLSVGFRWRG